MIAALDAEDIPVTPLGIPVEAGRMEHEFSHVQAQTGPFAVNVICVNADMLPLFAGEMGSGFFAGRHSIGLWFWEVSKFPERWMSSFEHLDEVWAASQHVADAVEAVSPIPVHTIRLPVVPVPPASRSRESLGLPDAYCFLFVFDHNSVLERKKPLGLIESFRRAFEPGSGPHLVLKTINGNRHPEDVKRVRAAVAEHPDVHLIEGYLPAEEKSAMIASCDCYVSLHRSEGFGLTMAEAMYFGKPTIATGYSGNLDFMTPDNSYLVDYRTRAIGDDADPYPTDGEWADPDLSHAASLMRQVFEEQEAAAERGRAAAADIRRTHSPHAAGEVIARQLEPVRAAMEGASGRVVDGSPSPPDLTTGPGAGAAPQASGASIVRAPGSMRARRLLERGVSPPRAGTGRIRRFLRGITLRAMKPFTEYQRAMNRNLVDSMGDLQRRIGELQFRDSGADHAAVLAAFRRYDRELGAIRAQLAALEHADQQRGPFEDFEHPSLGTVTGFRALPVAGSDSGVGSDAPGPESTEAIRERQHVYLELLADRAPVLEADCGPGEFLDRLREVDDGSLGAVLSAGLVQRLEFEGLRVFLELSLCKLKPGGLFIAEVTYPSGLLPDLFLTHCRMAGFAPAFVFDPDHYASAEADPLPASRYAIVATAPREESG
jgi:glycosyltransferase involved in cell wall biosynthesis